MSVESEMPILPETGLQIVIKEKGKNTKWAHGLMAAILVSWGHCQLPLSQSNPQALLGFMMNNLGFPGAEPGCIGFVW